MMAGSKARGIDPKAFRALWIEGPLALRSDADLVRVFADGHREAAEAAFEALVARHGPMVLGLCRRIVRDDHRAEDAFQATFLILARKARSVRVDDSLGRWLHGVARRVAVRASRASSREVVWPSRGVGPEDPATEAIRSEALGLVTQEVARLPRRFREVVVLCHLDGLSHDGAAEALGVPVGTVRSRLSRARQFLRSRLEKRGLAPSAVVAWLGEPRAAVDVPKSLLEHTLRNVLGDATVAASPGVLILADQTLRSFTMAKVMGAGVLVTALGGLTAGAVVLARGGEEPSKPEAAAAKPQAEAKPQPVASLEDQFRRILKEFDDAKDEYGKIADATKSGYERWKLYGEKSPDEGDYARRIVDLASKHPKEIASRDALIWVMYQPHRADAGAYGDEFARAARLLVAHRADDPEVARVALGFKNVLSRRRDAFLEGIYACAESREAKGLIRLALADYLAVKADAAVGVRKQKGRSVAKAFTYDVQGKLGEQTFPLSNEDEGYRIALRMLDVEHVRGESERLFEEVIAEYSDVPCISTHQRNLERRARETPSITISDPKKKREMVEIESYLATLKPRTLGQVACARLDDLRNLSVGKVAPEFEGTGADGKPIKLSDYRGQVVVLAYWFSTCGPCLREIPHERDLVAKMKGRPFTLVGIVTDGKADDARKVIESEKMTWPNVVTGGDKVAERYHISGNPSYYVLDAGGVIRSKGSLLSSQLDEWVNKLVAEAEAKKPTP